ncbi:unnamed protein product [Heligmosomoides polygyrus]|uniref:Aminopeptidase n=1 Tax=Heligmosomoides polygyrus TaxID=6339 RepID=A0A3P7YPT8_HELPZ|nr:unnamed protein product [Heligmosomoides polygyrus]
MFVRLFQESQYVIVLSANCWLVGSVSSGVIHHGTTGPHIGILDAVLRKLIEAKQKISLPVKEEDTYEEEEPAEGPSAEERRLPSALQPVWYNVTLKTYIPGFVTIPDGKNFTSDGNIMIKLDVKQSTAEIVLNANGLSFPTNYNKVKILMEPEISRARRQAMENSTELIDSLNNADEEAPMRVAFTDTGIKVTKIVYNSTLEQVRIKLDTKLEQGSFVVFQVPFNGRINERLSGLRLSTYKTKDNQSRALAFSDIKPNSQRMFWPFFDETRFNAPLTLTVLHPKGTTVRASAKEASDAEETSDPLWLKTSFGTTSPLTTPLSGFIVTDFQKAEAVTDTGTKIRVFCRPEANNSTDFALATAEKVFDILQGYFAIPPKSDKLDIFALPKLEVPAMSSDGLILIREDFLLYDQRLNNIEEKWLGPLTAAFESEAHWISDAVARYMEYHVLGKAFEGVIEKGDYQTVDSLEPALLNDARASSYPITVDNGTPSEAMEPFDRITSDKGAAVLRMIKAVIGEESFQRGFQNFLRDEANGNIKPDLWSALDGVMPKTMGYPVVEVYRIDEWTVELTQRRFKLDHLTPEKAKFRNALYWYKWDIPLFFEINGKPQEMTWLHEAIRLPLNVSDHLLINTESIGFYRVNYDEEGWSKIVRQLQKDHTKYPPSARARFVSDALALAASGQFSYETAFGVLSYLPMETEYQPWSNAAKGLEDLYDRMSETDLEPSVKEFVLKKLKSIFDKLDLSSLSFTEDKQWQESKSTSQIVKLYCKLSPEVCYKGLTSQFESNFLGNCGSNGISSVCSSVSPTIRSFVYCAGVAGGSDNEFEKVRQLSLREVNAVERKKLIEALACSRDPRKLRRLLHECVQPTKSTVDVEDVHPLMAAINNEPVGAEIVSNFVLDNWKELTERFSYDHTALSAVMRGALRFDSEREAKQFERFMADHKTSTRGLDVLKVKLEIARNRVQWLKNNKKTMKDLLISKHSDIDL